MKCLGELPLDTTLSKMVKANLSQFSYGNENIERNKRDGSERNQTKTPRDKIEAPYPTESNASVTRRPVVEDACAGETNNICHCLVVARLPA